MSKTFNEMKELFEKEWFTVTQDLSNLENYVNSQTWRNKWIIKWLYDSSKTFTSNWRYFLLEKDWQVADLTYWQVANDQIRIRWINWLLPIICSRYTFNKKNHELIKKISRENDLWMKIHQVMNIDNEIIKELESNEDYLKDESNIQDTNVLKLDNFSNLKDYLNSLSQWQRRKFRLAEKEFIENEYILEIVDSRTHSKDEIKEAIEKSMELNIKMFSWKDWTWRSMFREMNWVVSPWRTWTFEMDLEKQWVIFIKDKDQNIISSLFFYNDLENNYSLFNNCWYEKDLSKNAFQIVWVKYIDYCLNMWIKEIEMWRYWTHIYKRRFWSEWYGLCYTLYDNI